MKTIDTPLNILQVVCSGRWTGAAEPATNTALVQQAHGHRVAMACLGGSSFERRLGERQIPFVPGFHFDRRLNMRRFREDIALMRDWIEKNRPDIVHCHLPHDHWTVALATRSPWGRRTRHQPAIVRTIHREAPPRTDLPHRWLVGKGSDMVATASMSQRQAMIEQVGLPMPRVGVIPGAIDLERFNPSISGESIRREFDIPADARVVGMIARMQPHRGHHLLVDTIEQVLDAIPDVYYLMSGRGEIKSEMDRRLASHPLRRHLRRIAYRKTDLAETYAAADVMVLLVPGSDGTCRAMLEAMAMGRPVIGSRIGAMADTIRPDHNGWLIEPGDRNGLARAIIHALRDRETAREAGRNARREMEQHHSFENLYENMMDLYAHAIERNQARLERRNRKVISK